jgi:hypothetical protein
MITYSATHPTPTMSVIHGGLRWPTIANPDASTAEKAHPGEEGRKLKRQNEPISTERHYTVPNTQNTTSAR